MTTLPPRALAEGRLFHRSRSLPVRCLSPRHLRFAQHPSDFLGNRSLGLTPAQINLLLANDDDEEIELVEEDEDDDDYVPWNRRVYDPAPEPIFSPVTEPQEAGVNLLNSGEFGRVGYKDAARNPKTPEQSITKLIRQRYESVGRRRSALSREELMGVRGVRDLQADY